MSARIHLQTQPARPLSISPRNTYARARECFVCRICLQLKMLCLATAADALEVALAARRLDVAGSSPKRSSGGGSTVVVLRRVVLQLRRVVLQRCSMFARCITAALSHSGRRMMCLFDVNAFPLLAQLRHTMPPNLGSRCVSIWRLLHASHTFSFGPFALPHRRLSNRS